MPATASRGRSGLRLPRAPGLRARLTAALVLTSAATLVAASLALLSPLEHRLRTDQVRTLASTAQAARGGFQALDSEALHRGSRRVLRLTRSLARRTDARVAILDRHLRPLTPLDRDPGDSFSDAALALREEHTIRRSGQAGGPAAARVSVPVRIDGVPYVLVLRQSLREPAAAVRVVKHAFVVAALVGLAVAVLLGLGLASGLVRRLRRLRDAALQTAELRSDGSIGSTGARDEIDDLGRALTAMHARLRDQEEARRTFVSTASHELRTPLTSLRLMLENLEDELTMDDVDLRAAGEQVGRARGQARRLEHLARDLLDLSRIDAGIPLRRENVELDEVCRAVVAEFEPPATRRRVVLLPPTTETARRACGDPGGIARVLRILLENAIRLSPPSDPIEVSVEGDDGHVVLAVTDRGPGVPEADREVVFERFRRGSATAGDSGFGLGLAIGRELAQRMGGDLRLDPTECGARFALVLEPASAAPRR